MGIPSHSHHRRHPPWVGFQKSYCVAHSGCFQSPWLLLIALAGTAWADLFFWLGLLLIILPVAYRLFSVAVSRQERIGLVVFLGLSLYLVKVMHSPFMFTFSDELLHFRNADNILQSLRRYLEKIRSCQSVHITQVLKQSPPRLLL